MHRARALNHPTLPKSLEELYAGLNNIKYETKLGENFLLLNDTTTHTVMFGTHENEDKERAEERE